VSEDKKKNWLKLALDVVKLLVGFLAGTQL
jgi:hypothetical protein